MPADTTVPIVAIAVTGGVALASAILTPLTAHYRQKDSFREERERMEEQLKAERERLDAQLEAEAARLNQQLQHERDRDDRADLRALLDEIAGVTYEAMDAVTEIWSHVPSSTDEEKLREARGMVSPVLYDKLWPLYRQHERVCIRRGHGDPVASALRDLITVSGDIGKEILDLTDAPPDDTLNQQAIQKYKRARDGVIEAATALAGSRIEPDQPK